MSPKAYPSAWPTNLCRLTSTLEMKIEDVIEQIDEIPIQYVIFRISLAQSFFNWNWWHWQMNSNLDSSENGIYYCVRYSLSMDIYANENEILGTNLNPFCLYQYTFSQKKLEETKIQDIWDQLVLIPNEFTEDLNQETVQVVFTQSIFNKFVFHLGSLQFNNLEGAFVSTSKGLDWSMMYALKNVTLIAPVDQCVVCYESTRTVTHCNHPICIKCLRSLQSPKKCPMCRTFPITMQK